MTPANAPASGVGGFLAFLVKRGRHRFAFALGLLVLGGLTEGVSILMVIPLLSIIDGESGGSFVLPEWLPFGGASVSLAAALAALVGLIALHGLFTRSKNIYLADLLFDLLNQLRLDLFAAIGALRWQHMVRQRPSDLHHLLTADVERVYAAAMAVMMLLQTAILLAVYLAVAWVISPLMMLLASGLGIAILAILAPLRRRAIRFGLERTQNKRDQYRMVSEYLSGLKTARIHNAEEPYRQRLSANLDKVHDEAVGYMRLTSLGTIVSQLVSALAVAVLVFAGIRGLNLALPELVAMLVLLMRIAPRFTGLQNHFQQLLANVTVFDDIERCKAEWSTQAEPPPSAGAALPALVLERAIVLEQVSFAYAGDAERPAVEEVDCTIPAGAITALIGPSGSGKSTLADIVCGLLSPNTGKVLIDGAPLTPEGARAWRQQVAYVPQDPFLLDESIVANLRLAQPQASRSEIEDALERAGALAFASRLPQGIDTPLGDNGAQLSGGQRQRIALARALVMKPQLLVLDEATSALDWESQAAVARSIAALKGQVTILAIAHRLSMVAAADHVIALNSGRVVEVGRFSDLAAGDGPLARLVMAERSVGARQPVHSAPDS
ncbi:ABC transporter ATP-binding protein [Erythrobacter sp.]|uniref:ABC transporter ATP-binding protein n=1 Tax=Erythrobacter sp. TaxID=1042 RepID=UPI0025DEDF58|nr:ABC transporter ATP-binding protein [Erythrobacter sp.]